MPGDDAAGPLIERLLADPDFREEFMRSPAEAARRAGLPSLADEMLTVGADPLQTLEFRESRSSLAGVLMAAAVEGVGLAYADDAHAADFAHRPRNSGRRFSRKACIPSTRSSVAIASS